MLCKYCGKTIEDDSVFCRICGAKLVREKRKKVKEIRVPKPRQLASGEWGAQVMVNGRREFVKGWTEQEYTDKARALKAGVIEAKERHEPLTVGAAIDRYLSDNSRVLSPSTIKGYKSVRKHRFQALMGKDVHDPAVNWQAAVNEEAGDVSEKTLSNAWHLVTVSLGAAGADVPKVRLPKIPKADRPWLDYEQIKTFLSVIRGEDCEMAALLALHSLRRSELLALTADSVDLKKGTIAVRGAAVYNEDGELVQKKTNKTRTSTRTVPIMIPRLKELVKGASGRLVTTAPNTAYVQINRICEENGLPKVGVHGLRHSFASLAYHLGWSEATTMQVGGWNDSQTVHAIYTHLAAQDRNRDVRKMQEYYAGNKRKITTGITTKEKKA